MASPAMLLGAGIKLCTLSGLYPFVASGHLEVTLVAMMAVGTDWYRGITSPILI